MGFELNGHCPKLMPLLSDAGVTPIAIEPKDRLMRLGYEYIESALLAQGRKLIVIDETELTDDLIPDRIAILTAFCTRLYGHRVANNRAQQALKILTNGNQLDL